MESMEKTGANALDNEWTLERIFRTFGKSLPRMLAYCTAALLIAALIFGTVCIISPPDKHAFVTIKFNHPQIYEGLNPDGSVFAPSSMTTPSVVLAAIEAAGIEEEVLPEVTTRLFVQAVVPRVVEEQLIDDPTAEYFAPTYRVRLNNYRKAGLSDSEARAVVTVVAERYIGAYMSEFAGGAVSVPETATLGSCDYTEQLEALGVQLEATRAFVTAKSQAAPQFVSQRGYSFDDLARRLDALSGERLAALEAYVLSNALTKKDSAATELQLKIRINDIDAQTAALHNKMASLHALLEAYKLPTQIVSAGDGVLTELSQASTGYDELARSIAQTVDKLSALERRRATLQSRLELFSAATPRSGQGERAVADLMVEELVTALAAESQLINAAVTDYVSDYALNQSPRITAPAVTTLEGVRYKLAAYLLAVALLAGGVSAFFVTASRIQKQKPPTANQLP